VGEPGGDNWNWHTGIKHLSRHEVTKIVQTELT
jgi:hypothetical protein